jgi:sec-independent protein translocase protein TatB
MFFGLTIEKVLVIGVIAAILIGPERLPRYAEGLARWTGRARDFLRGARTRVQEEVGDDMDWRKLDPRQYDPRRIIREALLDDAPVPTVSAARAVTAATPPLTPAVVGPVRAGHTAPATPYDSEAT